MANDGCGVVFVFVDKLLGARESDLVDVFVHLLGSHTDTMVLHGEGLLVLINNYAYAHIAEFAFSITNRGQCFELLSGVHRVGYELAKENLVIRIEKFLDDRENVLGCYSNVTFCCHMIVKLKSSYLAYWLERLICKQILLRVLKF